MAKINDRMAAPVKEQTEIFDLKEMLKSVPDPIEIPDSTKILAKLPGYQNRDRSNSINKASKGGNFGNLEKYGAAKNLITNKGRIDPSGAIKRTSSMETTLLCCGGCEIKIKGAFAR